MRTMMMIILIVMGVFLAGVAAVAGILWWLGVGLGSVVVLGVGAVLVALVLGVVRPWYLNWGATDREQTMAMPGDDLVPDTKSATRAIDIAAPPEAVWPWLTQLGYGKAGWYSYDWIDNDGHPSADVLMPEYSTIEVGDVILMMSDMGFTVMSVDPGQFIVSLLQDGTTSWCLGVYGQAGGGTRLVTRWRPKWGKITVANAFMIALSDPGSFIMEQKMLRGIRDRAERSAALVDA